MAPQAGYLLRGGDGGGRWGGGVGTVSRGCLLLPPGSVPGGWGEVEAAGR